jgi:peptidoglycan/LPS O-acetylase OafA/YrhL
MRLTWRDAVATLFVAAIVAVCAAFVAGTDLWLISSVRGTTAVVLLLGIGGCAFGAVSELYRTGQSRATETMTVIASALGAAALIAAVTALITGSAYALTVLATATIAVWLTATIRHLFTAPRREPATGRDVHEVIPPARMAGR